MIAIKGLPSLVNNLTIVHTNYMTGVSSAYVSVGNRFSKFHAALLSDV